MPNMPLGIKKLFVQVEFFQRVCLEGRENTVGLEEGVYETPCTRKVNTWQLIYKVYYYTDNIAV